MKNIFSSITNSSVMLEGYRFDREHFQAQHVWTRSVIAGAICTGVVLLGSYSAYLGTDASFVAVLGAQATNFKLTAGAVLSTMLGYSLRDLLRSVKTDMKTQMRVARANSWLVKGTVGNHDHTAVIHMQESALGMVRFVELEGAIKIYAIAKHHEYSSPILIEAVLHDGDYRASSIFYSHAHDIRSTLNEACGEWSNMVADSLSITLSSPATHRSRAPDASDAAFDLEFDDNLLDDIAVTENYPFGRATAPVKPGQALRTVANVPADTLTH